MAVDLLQGQGRRREGLEDLEDAPMDHVEPFPQRRRGLPGADHARLDDVRPGGRGLDHRVAGRASEDLDGELVDHRSVVPDRHVGADLTPGRDLQGLLRDGDRCAHVRPRPARWPRAMLPLLTHRGASRFSGV